ncbi:hypothetical protein FGB62_71g232 [Gracilaria domingensis]|nr:hypothetical protein FGB62_71g232 [Gracilaria domingensis]
MELPRSEAHYIRSTSSGENAYSQGMDDVTVPPLDHGPFATNDTTCAMEISSPDVPQYLRRLSSEGKALLQSMDDTALTDIHLAANAAVLPQINDPLPGYIMRKVYEEQEEFLIYAYQEANRRASKVKPLLRKTASHFASIERKRNSLLIDARSHVREREHLRLLNEELQRLMLRKREIEGGLNRLMETGQRLMNRDIHSHIIPPGEYLPLRPEPDNNRTEAKHSNSWNEECTQEPAGSNCSQSRSARRAALKDRIVRLIEKEREAIQELEYRLSKGASVQRSRSQTNGTDNASHNLSIRTNIELRHEEQNNINIAMSRHRIEQRFASKSHQTNPESMVELASVVRGVHRVSERDEPLDMYYICHILASQFTNPGAQENLLKLLSVGAPGFPRQPILAKHVSKLWKSSLKHSPWTLALIDRVFESQPRSMGTPRTIQVEKAKVAGKLRTLLYGPLSESMTFDLSDKMNQLSDIQRVDSSIFEEWFEELLQGLQEETRHGEKEPGHVVGNPQYTATAGMWGNHEQYSSLGNRRRYAAAMVYWAINRYGDASHSVDSEFSILLLFSAAAALESCQQLLESNYVLALLADILSENIELLHLHLVLLENKVLVSEISRRVVPSRWMRDFHMNDDKPIGNCFRGQMFLLFMRLIALENDILLDEEDLIHLATVRGAGDFPFWDNAEQLRLHGICVQLRPHSAIPLESPTCMVIEYGHNSLIVMVEPARLTALGFSILSFILVPSEQTFAGFMKLIGLVRCFTNCFIGEYKGPVNPFITNKDEEEEHSNHESDGADQKEVTAIFSKVFIPIGWVYLLNMSSEFLRRHATVGSLGVLLGNDVMEPSLLNSENCEATEKVSPVIQLANLLSNKSIIIMNLKKCEQITNAQTHVPNERVYLDSDYKLVYEEPSKHKWRLKGVNAKAKAFSLSLVQMLNAGRVLKRIIRRYGL